VVAMARPWRGITQLTRGCIGLAGWPSAGSRARGDRVWDFAVIEGKCAERQHPSEPVVPLLTMLAICQADVLWKPESLLFGQKEG
jgi:hypothetical protein